MQPTIIQGPAIVIRGTLVVYTEGDVVVNYVRETWNPRGAITGALGERAKSTHMTVSCRPVGEISAALAALFWPHAPTGIGASIMAATALEIIPLAGNKYTFARSGVLKMPGMHLSPTGTAWSDDIQFVAMGDPAKEPTHATYFQALAATAANTAFDATRVISPRYTVAFGVDPYDAMEPEDGISISPIMETKFLACANYGNIDCILTSLGVEARFTPLDLTEAQYATLLKLQDAAALLPGQSLGTTDLVVSGTGLAVTLKNMGAGSGAARFGAGTFRQGEVSFFNKRTWTAGVPDVLWSFA